VFSCELHNSGLIISAYYWAWASTILLCI